MSKTSRLEITWSIGFHREGFSKRLMSLKSLIVVTKLLAETALQAKQAKRVNQSMIMTNS